jgi:hypothetical protein
VVCLNSSPMKGWPTCLTGCVRPVACTAANVKARAHSCAVRLAYHGMPHCTRDLSPPCDSSMLDKLLASAPQFGLACRLRCVEGGACRWSFPATFGRLPAVALRPLRQETAPDALFWRHACR